MWRRVGRASHLTVAVSSRRAGGMDGGEFEAWRTDRRYRDAPALDGEAIAPIMRSVGVVARPFRHRLVSRVSTAVSR